MVHRKSVISYLHQTEKAKEEFSRVFGEVETAVETAQDIARIV